MATARATVHALGAPTKQKILPPTLSMEMGSTGKDIQVASLASDIDHEGTRTM